MRSPYIKQYERSKANEKVVNTMKAKSGTDIEEVKRLNANSGLTYNQAKQELAKRLDHKKNNSSLL